MCICTCTCVSIRIIAHTHSYTHALIHTHTHTGKKQISAMHSRLKDSRSPSLDGSALAHPLLLSPEVLKHAYMSPPPAENVFDRAVFDKAMSSRWVSSVKCSVYCSVMCDRISGLRESCLYFSTHTHAHTPVRRSATAPLSLVRNTQQSASGDKNSKAASNTGTRVACFLNYRQCVICCVLTMHPSLSTHSSIISSSSDTTPLSRIHTRTLHSGEEDQKRQSHPHPHPHPHSHTRPQMNNPNSLEWGNKKDRIVFRAVC
jgi:hypothetical protein